MTNRRTNKNTSRNVENSPVTETSAERIARLEATIDQLSKKIQTMQDDFNNRIELLHQLVNENNTKSFVTATKIKQDVEQINEKVRNKVSTENSPIKPNSVDLPLPTLEGTNENDHPKKFLKAIDIYLSHKRVVEEEKMLLIESCLKGNAAKWYTMIKDASLNTDNFKQLFLKYFFSETKQWGIFMKCTEAGKTPTKENYQEHFHRWMDELKYLDSPKITEEQAINLIVKHFPISIQAFLQTTEKRFLSIWEKLGEVNNPRQLDAKNSHDVQTQKQNNTNAPFRQNRFNSQTTYRPAQNKFANSTPQNQTKTIKLISTEIEPSDEEEENELHQDETKNWPQGMGEMDIPLSQTP